MPPSKQCQMQLVTQQHLKTFLSLSCSHMRPIRWWDAPHGSAAFGKQFVMCWRNAGDAQTCLSPWGDLTPRPDLLSCHLLPSMVGVGRQTNNREALVALQRWLYWWHSFPMLIKLNSRCFFLLNYKLYPLRNSCIPLRTHNISVFVFHSSRAHANQWMINLLLRATYNVLAAHIWSPGLEFNIWLEYWTASSSICVY